MRTIARARTTRARGATDRLQCGVEFEGNPDYPIWTGGFWALTADTGADPFRSEHLLQTIGQNVVMVSEARPSPATGGIVLKSNHRRNDRYQR